MTSIQTYLKLRLLVVMEFSMKSSKEEPQRASKHFKKHSTVPVIMEMWIQTDFDSVLLDIVVHTFNPSSWEAEAGGSL